MVKAIARAFRWREMLENDTHATITEIAAGIGTREGAGATRQAADLAAWLRSVLGSYPDRVLVLNAEAALHARALARKAREGGVVAGFADLTVACIASARFSRILSSS